MNLGQNSVPFFIIFEVELKKINKWKHKNVCPEFENDTFI